MAKVVVIHGQMTGAMLEKRMIAFIRREYNVLVSTTIIENGIDIPLVNTLIVNRADRFGLPNSISSEDGWADPLVRQWLRERVARV